MVKTPKKPDAKKAAESVTKTLETLRADLKKYQEELDKIDVNDKKALAAKLEQIKKVKAQIAAIEGKPSEEERTAKSAAAKDNTRVQRAQELMQKIAELQAAATAVSISEDEKEIAAAKKKYETLEREAIEYFRDYRKSIGDTKKLSKEESAEYIKLTGNIARLSQEEYARLMELTGKITGLNAAQQKELSAIAEKQFGERSKKEYEQAQLDLGNFYNQQRQQNDEAYAAGEISRQEHASHILQLDTDEATDRARVAEDYKATVAQAAKDAEKAKSDATAKGVKERERLDDQEARDRVYRAERAVILSPKGSNAELEAQRALLKAKFDQETEFLTKNSEQYLTAKAKLNEDLEQLDRSYASKQLDLAQQVWSGISGIITDYTDLLNQRDQNALAKQQTSNDDRKQSYQHLLDANLISKREYDQRVKALDADMERRKKEIDHKAAARQKSLAILSLLINGAIGIGKIWAEYAAAPYVAAALTAGEVAAIGLQMAKVSEQEVPQGRQGLTSAMVLQGPSHEAGGMTMYNNQTGQPVAELEGGEPWMALSKSTYGNNKPLIDELIYNSLHRNGARVSAKWYDAPPARINTTRIIPLMRSGGTSSGDSAGQRNGTASGSEHAVDMAETNARLDQLIEEQRQTRKEYAAMKKDVRAYVVLQDYKDQETLLAKAKSVSGVKQAA